jgi:hypothetical protein
MNTIIVENKNKEVFLIPDWTMEHAGFIKNKEGKNIGHTDLKNSTGSIFNNTITNPMDLFNFIIDNENVEQVGNVYQAQYPQFVGWSALDTSGNKKITGIVLKQEAPFGSKVASTVLALAYENEFFGNDISQTHTLSAIAPQTNNIDFLPDDVKNNEKILQAMKEGKLRTFVSIFPGPIIINHQSLPKTSEFDKNIAFQVHPENSMYIKINANPEIIHNFIEAYNKESLKNNKEVNITEDKNTIIQKINKLIFHEKREHFLNISSNEEKITFKMKS